MEGKRLLLKRRVPRGRQRLALIFLGGFLVIFAVFIAQIRTTLSARTLAKVGTDVASMRDQFGSVTQASTTTEQQTAVNNLEVLKTYMEAAIKASAVATPAAPAASAIDPATPVLTPALSTPSDSPITGGETPSNGVTTTPDPSITTP